MSFNSIKLENSSIQMMGTGVSSNSISQINQTQGNGKLQPVLARKSNPSSSTLAIGGNTSSTSSASPELLRCKRRINFGGLGYALPQAQPATVARRNERERNRVKMVNLGFATLRQHVPNGAKNKKMSKVETLRSAVEYIRELRQLLGENDDMSYSDEHCSENLQMQSLSSDENWNPSPSTLSTSGTIQSPASISYTCNSTPINSTIAVRKSPNSPSSPMVTASPSPSMGSDASSPYDSLDSMERQVSPEEEELFDFATWFS